MTTHWHHPVDVRWPRNRVVIDDTAAIWQGHYITRRAPIALYLDPIRRLGALQS